MRIPPGDRSKPAMMSTHIIRRQFLNVEFDGSEAGALALQERLMALCRNDLRFALEKAFDRFAAGTEHWTIDRLDVDAGWFQPQELDRLIESVVQEVDRQLRGWANRAESARQTVTSDVPPEPWLAAGCGSGLPLDAIQRKTESQSIRQAFLYFLEMGVLPWWFQLPAASTLEEVIRAMWQRAADGEGGPEYFASLLDRIMRSAPMRNRLVRQFSAEFLTKLLQSLSPEAVEAVREVFVELQRRGVAGQAPLQFLEQVWERAFVRALTGVRITAATLIRESLEAIAPETRQQHFLFFERMETVWPQLEHGGAHPKDSVIAREATTEAAIKAHTGRKSNEQTASPLDLKAGVFANCAGMVLLHPFLSRLFEGLGIAEKDKLLQPERGLCLLHFLATGLRFAPEYDLLIGKILCNVPLDTPVDSRIELTAAEEEEAAALLAAVLRHWDALGDTSVENLRGSFLVRPGKLSQRDGDWVLQVERRSYDILLDRLPWGLGLIQLPWMQKILWVEWRF